MKQIKKIVVGTDFSSSADHAFDEALGLAALVGAEIILVHAYEIPTYSLPDAVILATPQIVNQLAEGGQKGLDERVSRTKGGNIAVRAVLRVGPPWIELGAVADEEGADLIVVGTHGRRGLSRALLGSVAERTVRTASRPVLVMHAEQSPSR